MAVREGVIIGADQGLFYGLADGLEVAVEDVAREFTVRHGSASHARPLTTRILVKSQAIVGKAVLALASVSFQYSSSQEAYSHVWAGHSPSGITVVDHGGVVVDRVATNERVVALSTSELLGYVWGLVGDVLMIWNARTRACLVSASETSWLRGRQLKGFSVCGAAAFAAAQFPPLLVEWDASVSYDSTAMAAAAATGAGAGAAGGGAALNASSLNASISMPSARPQPATPARTVIPSSPPSAAAAASKRAMMMPKSVSFDAGFRGGELEDPELPELPGGGASLSPIQRSAPSPSSKRAPLPSKVVPTPLAKGLDINSDSDDGNSNTHSSVMTYNNTTFEVGLEENKALREELAMLREELLLMEREAEGKEARLRARLDKEKSELERELADERQARGRQEHEVSRLREQVEELQEQHQRQVQLQRQQVQTSTSTSALLALAEQDTEALAEHAREADLARAEAEQLRAELDRARAEAAQRLDRAVEAEREAGESRLAALRAELERETAAWSARLAAAEAHGKSGAGDTARLRRDLERCLARAEASEAERTEALQEVAAARLAEGRLRAEIDEARGKLDGLDAAFAARERELVALRGDRARLGALEAALAARERELAEAREVERSFRSREVTHRTRIEELEISVQTGRSDLLARIAVLERHNDELKAIARKEKDNLPIVLAEADERVAAAKVKFERDLAEVQVQVELASARVDDARAEALAAHDEATRLRAALTLAESAGEDLAGRLAMALRALEEGQAAHLAERAELLERNQTLSTQFNSVSAMCERLRGLERVRAPRRTVATNTSKALLQTHPSHQQQGPHQHQHNHLQQLSAQLQRATEVNAAQAARIEHMSVQAQRLEALNETLEARLQREHKQVVELSAELKRSGGGGFHRLLPNNQQQQQQQQQQASLDALHALQAELEDWRAQYALLRTQHDMAQATVGRLQADLAQAQSQAQKPRRTSAEAAESGLAERVLASGMALEVTRLKEALAARDGELRVALEAAETAGQELAREKRRTETLKAEVEAADAELRRLAQTLEDTRRGSSGADGKISELLKALAIAQDSAADARGRASALEAELGNAAASHRAAAAHLKAQMEAEGNGLKEQIHQQQLQIQGLQKQLAQAHQAKPPPRPQPPQQPSSQQPTASETEYLRIIRAQRAEMEALDKELASRAQVIRTLQQQHQQQQQQQQQQQRTVQTPQPPPSTSSSVSSSSVHSVIIESHDGLQEHHRRELEDARTELAELRKRLASLTSGPAFEAVQAELRMANAEVERLSSRNASLEREIIQKSKSAAARK